MNHDILMVDDDPAILQFMGRIVSIYGRPRIATDGITALRIAREQTPDLVLLDAEMPGMDGFQVCRAMKSDPSLEHVPVIFVTSHNEPEYEVMGLHLGAEDFMVKPLSADRLISRIQARLHAKQQLEAQKVLSTLDALTALPNLTGFQMQLDREWRRSLSAGTPISLMQVSMDHFAAYEERYGRPTGQDCIHRVAAALEATCKRPADVTARMSGSTFAIVLPETPRKDAETFANRVLASVESLNLAHASSPSSRLVTVSVGLSTYDEETSGWIGRTSEFRRAGFVKGVSSKDDLVEASQSALLAASSAGHAQAWFLDSSNCQFPSLARQIYPTN